jgi:hypothetical protein
MLIFFPSYNIFSGFRRNYKFFIFNLFINKLKLFFILILFYKEFKWVFFYFIDINSLYKFYLFSSYYILF